MLPIQIKQLEKKVDAIRKVVIAELKKLIGKDGLQLSANEILINHQNTDHLMTYITKKGYATDDGPEFVVWSETSTDVLILTLKLVKKNIKKLR